MSEPRRPVVPPAVRSVPPEVEGATRLVLVRHGEAVCNVEGVVGGVRGCTGLTSLGTAQVSALAARLRRTGELSGVAALYASVLPRARETAAVLAPSLDAWRDGPPLEIRAQCDLCELHPGEGDGLDWDEFTARYGAPTWDLDPTVPLSPGGESWTVFVARAARALEDLTARHPGQLVVVACHAGVVEAAMLEFLPIHLGSLRRARLRTSHASLTEFERSPTGWVLRRYNDATPLPAPPGPAQQA